MIGSVTVFGWPAWQLLIGGGSLLVGVVWLVVALIRNVDFAGLVDLADFLPSTEEPDGRGADAPAPAGAVEYVADINEACSGASAEFVLVCVLEGRTRDQSRAAWIARLLAMEGAD